MNLFKKGFEAVFAAILGNNQKINYIYGMAEARAIDIIARMIATREIETYEKIDKKIQKNKGKLYYSLNIKPNPNESGTQFLYKLILQLLTEKKALVVINKVPNNMNYLYVADDFKVNNQIMYSKIFYDVVLSDSEGNTQKLIKKYNNENSIYFSIKNDELKNSSVLFKNETQKILNAAHKKFVKANLPKWRLKTPGGQPKILDIKTGEEIKYDDYKTQITEGLLSDDEAIVMLSEKFGLDNLNESLNKNSNDINEIYKIISDEVANKWQIPLDIFYGKQTEKSNAINDFMTLGLRYYFELLEDGFNDVLVGIDDFLKGEYIKFNTLTINHKDILDSANGIDKLTGDGFSRNEINDFIGLPHIDEDWADEHNLTKNYGDYSKKKEGENE